MTKHDTRTTVLVLAAVAATAGGLLAPPPASAQTPVTSLGLGYPVAPVDARAAALGGVGVGLLDGSFSIRNPADLVEFERAALSVTATPENVTVTGPEGKTGADRSRFSVIRAVLPLGPWAASVGFGNDLDQDWRFRTRDTLTISTGRFPFEQRREDDGGVSTVDLSLARSVGPVSLGVSYQALTGSVRQTLLRRFEISVDSTVRAPNRVEQEANWSYSGWRLTAGLGVEVGGSVRVSGYYAWTGDLDAERDSLGALEGIRAESRTFGMPASAGVGVSARPLDDLLVTAGGGWTGWSETELPEEGTTDVYWGGGGVEYTGLQLGSFPIRLRAGGRHAELPFSLPGRAAPTESAVTLGLGTAFASGLARLDFAAELGSRGDRPTTGMEESFQRFSITATIHQ